MSVAITAWILHIHYQDPKDCKWMGPILRSFIFGCLARAVRHKSQRDYGNLSADNSSGNGTSTMSGDKLNMDQMAQGHQTSEKNRGGMLESEVHKIRQFLEDRKKDRDIDDSMKEVEEAPLQEWKEAVIIIDKFFFWFYTFGNILIALTFTVTMITSAVEVPW